MLARSELKKIITKWNKAWNEHDLETVMDLFHQDILFDNWTGGTAKGKAALNEAWSGWFKNHDNFKFIDEEIFIDETEQKILYRWTLEWPSMERGAKGKLERRRGVDILHFKNGKIIKKLTYSKTTIEIDGKQERLAL